MITKEQAIALYGSQAQLARALDIKSPSISGWKPGEPIPEAQYLKLRFILKPGAFDVYGQLKPGALEDSAA